ncbi:MAG TPA: type II toxin-antitoxin system RelE/ParE family toxin [Candidatus Nanoarchaeia archaeon]|nr:type II toxin-antitoxin system RelE/ParE family toxin [Candidatus Nanoarchaeia archaeon]
MEFTETAEKFLKKLDTKEATTILQKIYALRDNPFRSIKKLHGGNLWRLRIGDYRAVLEIIISGQRIIVVRIGHRKNIYDNV